MGGKLNIEANHDLLQKALSLEIIKIASEQIEFQR